MCNYANDVTFEKLNKYGRSEFRNKQIANSSNQYNGQQHFGRRRTCM